MLLRLAEKLVPSKVLNHHDHARVRWVKLLGQGIQRGARRAPFGLGMLGNRSKLGFGRAGGIRKDRYGGHGGPSLYTVLKGPHILLPIAYNFADGSPSHQKLRRPKP